MSLQSREKHRNELCPCGQPRWWHWSMAVQGSLDHEFGENGGRVQAILTWEEGA